MKVTYIASTLGYNFNSMLKHNDGYISKTVIDIGCFRFKISKVNPGYDESTPVTIKTRLHDYVIIIESMFGQQIKMQFFFA